MKQYHKKYIWKRGAACMLAIALAFSGITWNGLAVSNAAGAGIPNANFNKVSLPYVSNWTQDGAEENAVEIFFNGIDKYLVNNQAAII